MKHIFLILMVIALVSCASPKVEPLSEESTLQEVVAPVQMAEVAEVAQTEQKPVKEEVIAVKQEPVNAEKPVDNFTEEVAEPVIEADALQQASIKEFVAQPVLVPITQHYVINKQDIYVSAYIGEATVSYPDYWNSEVVDGVIAYLANKYPVETKDITFKHENSTLTFFYPATWGEAQYNYAISLLAQELAEVKQPKPQATLEAMRPIRILDKEETEAPDKTIVYEPETELVTEPIVETFPETEIADYIDSWWEDPIFMGPTIEPESGFEFTPDSSPIVVYEEIVTIREEQAETEKNIKDEEVLDTAEIVVVEKPEDTDIVETEVEQISVASVLESFVPLGVLLTLAFAVVIIAKRKK